MNSVDMTSADKFKSVMKEIRSIITFHYDNSGKFLRKGFIKHFYTMDKTRWNQDAFYSLENTIESTRFYFSDAAAEASYTSLINKVNNFDERLFDYLEVVNYAVMKLMKQYFDDLNKGTLIK